MKRGRVVLLALLWLSGLQASAQEVLDLFKRVNPAVVVLNTIASGPAAGGGQVSLQGLGSGVLIDSTHVVTAAHVVQTADVVEVEFITGEKIYANVVASNPMSDLSLLELESEPVDVRPVELGDSDDEEVGTEVFVVGAPMGLSHSLTVGHISARRGSEASSDTLASDVELFQTDAAINSGNSGGPMFNMDGEVIGIVSYILSQSGGFEGLGFVITSNTARRVLLENPSFWSGLTGVLIAGDLARLLNIPVPAGFLVQNVAQFSPAERVGLRPSTIPVEFAGRPILLGGDILLAVDGITFSEADGRERILERFNTLEIGDSVRIDLLRGGARESVVYYRVRE